MKRTAQSALAVFLVLCLAGCRSASPTLPPGDTPSFERRLDELRRGASIPGMVAVVARGDQIVWEKAFGHANVEGGILVTPETSFHLASLTKPFAATILMQLVQEGKLSLDAPVANFGINLPSSGTIRVRHLLTHTSEGDPGSSFRYNGDRFALLDQVILGASGRSFGELLVERIIGPLQLTRTAPNVANQANFQLTGYDPTAFRANLASGYAPDGRTPQPYPSGFSSAAGLISSARDVVRFSRALDTGSLVSAQTRELMFTPATSTSGGRLPYGLGWFAQQAEGARLIWHYGYWTGNSSLIVKVPDQGLTFVLLANSDMLSRPYGLGGDEDVLRSPYARAFVDVFVAGS